MEGVHIPMTSPVVTTHKPTAGPFNSSAYTVSLLLPASKAARPPHPHTDSRLTITSLPERCILTRRFPGFALPGVIAREAVALRSSLEGTAWENVTLAGRGGYSVAQYNSPLALVGRVNEIWVEFEGRLGADGGECEPVGHSPVVKQGRQIRSDFQLAL